MTFPTHPTSLTFKILIFLVQQKGVWATWGESYYMPSVQQVFPVGTSEDLQFRFMRRLQTKGLVGGCDCGCRADYAPLHLGLTLLMQNCSLGNSAVKDWYANNYREGY